MTVLDDLPYETFLNIFSSLSSTDLASASLVSRRWHVISEPVLYREPNIYHQPSSANSWRQPRVIELFLRTLLIPGCERLAFHVRSLCLPWRMTTIDLTPRRRSNLAILAAAESRFGVTHSPAPGSPDSQVVLLMHLLPRLQRLHLVPPGVRDNFNDFFDGIGPTQPLPLSFQSLINFDWDWSNTNTSISAQEVLALLQLQYMKTVQVDMRGEFDGNFPTNVQGTSGVTILYLRCSETAAVLIACILSVPRALERFIYHGQCVHRATLTHLRLEFIESDDADPLVERLSLRGWPVLRELLCPLKLLVGFQGPAHGPQLAERLPACIQRLQMVYCGYYSEDDNWSFAEEMDSYVQLVSEGKWIVPRLEKLIVTLDLFQAMPARLCAACEASGVALSQW